MGGCVTFALACNVEMELMAGSRGIVVRTVGGMSRTATPIISCRCGHSITQSLVYYLHTQITMENHKPKEYSTYTKQYVNISIHLSIVATHIL